MSDRLILLVPLVTNGRTRCPCFLSETHLGSAVKRARSLCQSFLMSLRTTNHMSSKRPLHATPSLPSVA